MSIGVGVILYLLGKNPETLKTALICVCTLMLSMAGGRVVGIVLDGNPNILMFVYLALEILVSALAFLLLRTTPKA
jgi:hypothetical protein